MLRALPSLVDIVVPEGKHFTVCGDVHGQVMNILTTDAFLKLVAVIFVIYFLSFVLFFQFHLAL